MGDCCNVRTLSYISASLQLAGWIIMLLIATLFGSVFNSSAIKKTTEEDQIIAQTGTILAIGLAIVAVIAMAFLITLLVGIKQNRITLVSIYVYAMLVLLGLNALTIFYYFVMGFVNKLEIGTVFLDLFLNLVYMGIYILMFAPIFLLHKQMRNPRYQPEQHGLRGNQPVNKPNYAA